MKLLLTVMMTIMTATAFGDACEEVKPNVCTEATCTELGVTNKKVGTYNATTKICTLMVPIVSSASKPCDLIPSEGNAATLKAKPADKTDDKQSGTSVQK